MVYVIMGVAGCGKTTVGRLLAQRLGVDFLDGDDYHSVKNKEKLASGTPLTDGDRLPWLERIRELMAQQLLRGEDVVVACSALKRKYRDILTGNNGGSIRFIHLVCSEVVAAERIRNRTGHFMPASLVRSQFGDLEPPVDSDNISSEMTPVEIVEKIMSLIRR